MNQNVKERISWWHIRANREEDHWVRFLLYYLIFDAYITDGSSSSSDKEKLDWFLNNDNSLKSSFSGCWNTRILPKAKSLKALSPVKDMRPDYNKSIPLIDETDLKELFNFIYQIRCNLFHGSKDRMEGRDSNLVFHSGTLLKDAINWWIFSTF